MIAEMLSKPQSAFGAECMPSEKSVMTPTCMQDECHVLASVMNEVPQGILVLDDEGVITHANLAMSILFLPLQVLPGVALAKLDGLEKISRLVNEAYFTHRRVEENFSLLSQSVNASVEGERYFHAVATPWIEADKYGVWVLLEEKTDYLCHEQSHIDFISKTGDELRAPLSLIHGYLETLRGGMIKNAASLQRCLDVMEKHSRKMMRIIDDMLILSRLECDREPLKKNPFLVRGCVEDALDHLTPLVARYEAAVTLNFPADGGLLYGDRFYWDQIFTNLLEHTLRTNAHPGLHFQITGQWSAHECILMVEDNGIGIPADELPLVFERFYRPALDQASEARGTGLGLSIVKLATEAHQGSIEVESEPSVKTVFTLRLPLP